jgi:aryl-alcohol dehydrogenase-like predicted oxidoreductase
MQYVTFGSTGRRVSRMCLGRMMFGRKCSEAEAARIMDAAIERGVDNVDTAASYAEGVTEEIVGRLLKGRRDDAAETHRSVPVEIGWSARYYTNY